MYGDCGARNERSGLQMMKRTYDLSGVESHVVFNRRREQSIFLQFLRRICGENLLDSLERLPGALGRGFEKTHVICSEIVCDDEALAFLGTIQSLEQLGLVDCQITCHSLEPITRLPFLTHVSFADSRFQNTEMLSDLEGSSTLKSVVLSGANVTEKMVNNLRGKLNTAIIDFSP